MKTGSVTGSMHERTVSLIGQEKSDKLKQASVIVFGVGGVGGAVIEALARAGIGALTIVDFDTIDVSNINRQIIALRSTVGKLKVDVMRDRLLDINPEITVMTHSERVTENGIAQYNLAGYNYIIDAIDEVRAKLAIIREAKRVGRRIISSMGTGNKLDPTGFKICDIRKTHTCPLAKRLRKELRNEEQCDLKVLFSDEQTVRADASSSTPSSISYMPATAGLLIASEVLNDIME